MVDCTKEEDDDDGVNDDVIGAVSMVIYGAETWMKKIGIDCQVELLQKGSLLVTTRIIQEVMTLLEPVENVMPPYGLSYLAYWTCLNDKILRFYLRKY